MGQDQPLRGELELAHGRADATLVKVHGWQVRMSVLHGTPPTLPRGNVALAFQGLQDGGVLPVAMVSHGVKVELHHIFEFGKQLGLSSDHARCQGSCVFAKVLQYEVATDVDIVDARKIVMYFEQANEFG